MVLRMRLRRFSRAAIATPVGDLSDAYRVPSRNDPTVVYRSPFLQRSHQTRGHLRHARYIVTQRLAASGRTGAPPATLLRWFVAPAARV